MSWWIPVQTEPSRKKWWDTRLSRKFSAEGLAAHLWVKCFFPTNPPQAENDRDSIRW